MGAAEWRCLISGGRSGRGHWATRSVVFLTHWFSRGHGGVNGRRSSGSRRLTAVRELPFPDMFAGEFDGARVAYCCAYGAARAVEPAHVFAQLGTPLVVQIGTCGVMTDEFGAGTVAVPRKAEARDGVSQHYGAGASVGFASDWAGQAEDILQDLAVAARDTSHLTWPSLFAQSDAMCAGWAAEGLQTVDMEAAAVGAVAARFGVSAIALLSAWDALSEGQTFLDPLPEAQREALRRADLATFETALHLAREVSRR